MKAKHAWLIRWDISTDKRDRIVADQILTFLDARLSEHNVEKIMKALWVSHSRLMWREKLRFALTPNRLAPCFVIKRDGRIFVGIKPRLNATLVNDVEAFDEDGGGIVSWSELRGSETKRFEQRNLPLPT
jgi:hypothetical protein